MDMKVEKAIIQIGLDIEDISSGDRHEPRLVYIVSIFPNPWVSPSDEVSRHTYVMAGIGFITTYHIDDQGHVYWAVPDYVYARLVRLGANMAWHQSIETKEFRTKAGGLPRAWTYQDQVLDKMAMDPVLSPFVFTWGYSISSNTNQPSVSGGAWGASSAGYTFTVSTATQGNYNIVIGQPRSPKAWDCDVQEGYVQAE